MDMLDLRILIELFETGSISKVAKNIPLSYSAVNARLENIENEVEVPLFIRSSRGTEFTEAGQRFYYFAYKSYLAYETGINILQNEIVQKKNGELFFGVTRPLVHIVAPVFSNLMNEKKSFGEWHIQTGDSLDLMLLTNGEALHMSIINQNDFIPPSLEQKFIFEDPIHLVGQRGAKLPEYDSLFHILERIPLILLKRGFPLRELAEEKIFQPMGFTPRQLIEVDDTDLIKELVKRGVGYSFLPNLALWNMEESIDLYSKPVVTQKFHLIYSKSFSESHKELIKSIVSKVRTNVKQNRGYGRKSSAFDSLAAKTE